MWERERAGSSSGSRAARTRTQRPVRVRVRQHDAAEQRRAAVRAPPASLRVAVQQALRRLEGRAAARACEQLVRSNERRVHGCDEPPHCTTRALALPQAQPERARQDV